MKERRVFKFCFRADRVRSLKREMTLFRLIKERIGDHPNIVALREVYFEQPPFYVEEDFVAGDDLASWCQARGGPEQVPLDVKLGIVAQIADALQAAHDAGVIHRDVKPQNILVSGGWQVTSDRGEVTRDKPSPGSEVSTDAAVVADRSSLSAKLTDFGIGQVVSQEYLCGITKAGFTETILSSSSTSQTGTHLYMAPELLAGKPATTRSDIYSLGVVLYQFLVSDFSQPVTADWSKRLNDPLLREDLEHCFAGTPEERFPGVRQLADNLRSLAERRERREEALKLARRAEQRHRLAVFAGAAAVVLLMLAAVLLYGLRRADEETLKARRIAYASDMNAAWWAALRDNNLDQVQYLLEVQIPKPGLPDLRHWEWRYLWQQCRGEQLSTLGPIGEVAMGLAVLPDNRLAVGGGGGDGRAYLWDLARQEILRTSKFKVNTSSLAASADGRRLAVAAWEQVVTILDGETLEVVGEIHHTNEIWRIALSPKGDLLAAAGRDLSVWDLATSNRLWAIETPDEPGDVLFLPDGESVVIAQLRFGVCARVRARDGKVIWPLAPQNPFSQLHPEDGQCCLAVSPNGTVVAAGSWRGRLGLFEASTGNYRELTNYGQVICAVAFAHNARQLAVCGSDRIVRLWDLEGGKEKVRFRGHRKRVMKMAFSSDDRQLFTASDDGTVRAWDTQTPLASGTEAEGSWTNWIQSDLALFGRSRITRDARVITARATNGVRQVVNLETFRQLGTAQLPTNASAIALSREGRFAAAGAADGSVVVWDVTAGKAVWSFHAHSNEINALEFSPKSDRLATAARGADIQLWKLGTEQPELTRVLGGPLTPLTDMAFTPDGKVLAVPTYGRIDLIGLEPEIVDRRIRHEGSIFCIDISRDGSLIAAGGQERIAVWDLESLRLVVTLRGSLGAFTSVLSFSPDGRRLIAADNNEITWLWDLATGREVARFGPSQFDYAHFQPDGDTIVLSRLVGHTPLRARNWAGLSFLRAPTWAEIAATEKADAVARQLWIGAGQGKPAAQ
jgi:WD40 repeat protein/serine/threonine protein kinase